MATVIPRLNHPELIFGFVAPIGVDLRGAIDNLSSKLTSLGYNCIELKVTDIFMKLSEHIPADEPLASTPEANRYKSYIKYGNKLRATFNDDAALAVLTIARIAKRRAATFSQTADPAELYTKNAFILHQFKRKEEIDLLRSLYGSLFFQISVYSRRGARVDFFLVDLLIQLIRQIETLIALKLKRLCKLITMKRPMIMDKRS